MSDDVEIVIIGAGAAGIGAGHRLSDAGRRFVILEARDRLGGRAWTVEPAPGLPVDLGCEWLHSADRNPWTGIARELGMVVSETLPSWGSKSVMLRRSDSEFAAWQALMDRYWQALDTLPDGGPDRPAAALVPDSPWRNLADAVTTWISGAELDRISAIDQARYADSRVNWRVPDGYGTLIARHGADLPVRLGTPATAIDHRGTLIAVETPRGTLRARAVIVTVPTACLAAETIRVTPRLPDAKLAAAHGLPMGLDNKLFLAVEGDPFGLAPETQLAGRPERRDTGAYHLRPHGRPLVSAFYGGDLAHELEQAGPAATTDFAVAELAGLFGSAVRGRLTPLAHSAWAADPWARGSCSYAKPGQADQRAVLAAPIDDRLFFAGEATSRDAYSTAHGAYLSGRAAAEAALRVL